jgi:hypothetical protein
MPGDPYIREKYTREVKTAQVVVRLVIAGLCSASVASCFGMHDLPEESKSAPDVRKAVPNIKVVAGQYHLTGQLEIAGPIEAPVASTPPWIICLKSNVTPRQTYALFYRADIYVSSRISTIGDRCDSQAYQPIPN